MSRSNVYRVYREKRWLRQIVPESEATKAHVRVLSPFDLKETAYAKVIRPCMVTIGAPHGVLSLHLYAVGRNGRIVEKSCPHIVANRDDVKGKSLLSLLYENRCKLLDGFAALVLSAPTKEVTVTVLRLKDCDMEDWFDRIRELFEFVAPVMNLSSV